MKQPFPIEPRIKGLYPGGALAKYLADHVNARDIRATDPLKTTKASGVMKHDVLRLARGQAKPEPNMIMRPRQRICIAGLHRARHAQVNRKPARIEFEQQIFRTPVDRSQDLAA
jgi:hypothetical protein